MLKRFYFFLLFMCLFLIIPFSSAQSTDESVQSISLYSNCEDRGPDAQQVAFCYGVKAILTGDPSLCSKAYTPGTDCIRVATAVKNDDPSLCIGLGNQRTDISCVALILAKREGYSNLDGHFIIIKNDKLCETYGSLGGNINECNEYRDTLKFTDNSQILAKFQFLKIPLFVIFPLIALSGLIFLKKKKYDPTLKGYLYASSYCAYFYPLASVFLITIIGLLFSRQIGWGIVGLKFFADGIGITIIHRFFNSLDSFSFLISFIANGLLGGLLYNHLLIRSSKNNNLTNTKEFFIYPLLTFILTFFVSAIIVLAFGRL